MAMVAGDAIDAAVAAELARQRAQEQARAQVPVMRLQVEYDPATGQVHVQSTPPDAVTGLLLVSLAHASLLGKMLGRQAPQAPHPAQPAGPETRGAVALPPGMRR